MVTINKNLPVFTGFMTQTFDFLRDLKENNSRVWFETHKNEYKKYLMEPLQSLVQDLGPMLLSIDPYIDISPSVNKTISRINRDTRFSKDKSLYKDTIWITFKRSSKDWKTHPAFFFEISPRAYRYGMGYYSADKNTMDQFRELIISKPKEFLEIHSLYLKQNTFVLEGEKYKRILSDTIPPEIADWYQRKNLYLVCNKAIDHRVFSGELFNDLVEGFGLLVPFYNFLRTIK